jgi:hypothetical protein
MTWTPGLTISAISRHPNGTAATVGVHPEFVSMVRDLVPWAHGRAPSASPGDHGPSQMFARRQIAFSGPSAFK